MMTLATKRLGRIIFRGLAAREPRRRNRQTHGHKTLRQSLFITGQSQPYDRPSRWDEMGSILMFATPNVVALPSWAIPSLVSAAALRWSQS